MNISNLLRILIRIKYVVSNAIKKGKSSRLSQVLFKKNPRKCYRIFDIRREHLLHYVIDLPHAVVEKNSFY